MAERQLVFVQQPTRVRIPNAIWPPVRLEVRIGDHVDPKIIDGEVKLSILSGPPGGQIIGTSTARCPNGVATFDDLRFSVPGTYTLIAECDEDKLDLAGLEGHSSLMFLDMATGVDEQNRLVCQRTGYVLIPALANREPPTPIDSPLGEGTARRFINGTLNYWSNGSQDFPGMPQALADGAAIHALYRQHELGNIGSLGEVIAIRASISAVAHTRIAAAVYRTSPPRQEFVYGNGSVVATNSNIEDWSLLSLGAVGGVARCYINGTQIAPDFDAGTVFSPARIQVGRLLCGDIAQIGIEPVSSLEDMDAKALHAAKMCRVIPWVS